MFGALGAFRVQTVLFQSTHTCSSLLFEEIVSVFQLHLWNMFRLQPSEITQSSPSKALTATCRGSLSTCRGRRRLDPQTIRMKLLLGFCFKSRAGRFGPSAALSSPLTVFLQPLDSLGSRRPTKKIQHFLVETRTF